MRLKKDLERLLTSGEGEFGYVDITMFNCPPFVMFTNNSDCGICGLQLRGETYEPGSTYVWSRLAPLATSIFDVGTRCGEYSLIAAALRQDIPIISCEPNPDGFARLQVNMLANGIKNMKLKRAAVGGKEGVAHFGWLIKSPGHISSGGHVVDVKVPVGDDLAAQIYVEVTTLDQLTKDIEVGDKPLLKIDAEGAEYEVFKGMQEKLLPRRPDIIIETFSPPACALINELTAPLGYRYFVIDETRRALIPRKTVRPAQFEGRDYNHLLTVRSPQELAALVNIEG